MISKFLHKLREACAPPNYEVLESKNRISQESALFQVGRDDWRYIKGDRFVDIYMEGILKSYKIDITSISHWRTGKYDKFRIFDASTAQAEKLEPISEEERTRIASEVKHYLEQSRGWRVEY